MAAGRNERTQGRPAAQAVDELAAKHVPEAGGAVSTTRAGTDRVKKGEGRPSYTGPGPRRGSSLRREGRGASSPGHRDATASRRTCPGHPRAGAASSRRGLSGRGPGGRLAGTAPRALAAEVPGDRAREGPACPDDGSRTARDAYHHGRPRLGPGLPPGGAMVLDEGLLRPRRGTREPVGVSPKPLGDCVLGGRPPASGGRAPDDLGRRPRPGPRPGPRCGVWP